MIFPTIHLNGTSKNALMDEWNDAYAALYDALKVLQEAAPNGRDYYPQGATAFSAAVDEHVRRLEKIKDVMREIDTLREHVASQPGCGSS